MIPVMHTQSETIMKPFKSILDRDFVYVPSSATSVDQTWRRYGWQPTTEAGRTHETHTRSADVSSQASLSQR